MTVCALDMRQPPRNQLISSILDLTNPPLDKSYILNDLEGDPQRKTHAAITIYMNPRKILGRERMWASYLSNLITGSLHPSSLNSALLDVLFLFNSI